MYSNRKRLARKLLEPRTCLATETGQLIEMKGSRKQQNVNVATGFYFEPPSNHASSASSYSNRSCRKHPSAPAITQAQYLAANFRFILAHPLKKLLKTDFLFDPDVFVPWETVGCVELPATKEKEDSSSDKCPICLNNLMTTCPPRTSKCGHALCLMCVVRLIESNQQPGDLPTKMSSSSALDIYLKSSFKCPICSKMLFYGDLRPVTFKENAVNAVEEKRDDNGCVMTFKLLQVAKGSLFPNLVDTSSNTNGPDIDSLYQYHVGLRIPTEKVTITVNIFSFFSPSFLLLFFRPTGKR